MSKPWGRLCQIFVTLLEKLNFTTIAKKNEIDAGNIIPMTSKRPWSSITSIIWPRLFPEKSGTYFRAGLYLIFFISRNFFRTVSSIDLISLEIQILGPKVLFKNLGFKSLWGRVNFFAIFLFSSPFSFMSIKTEY